MKRRQLEVADFGDISVFYHYHPPEPALIRPHGLSEPPVMPRVDIERIVVGDIEITNDLAVLLCDDWGRIERTLLDIEEMKGGAE